MPREEQGDSIAVVPYTCMNHTQQTQQDGRYDQSALSPCAKHVAELGVQARTINLLP